MIIEVSIKDRNQFNKLALHPLQSWEWGEFRKKTGLDVIRLGRYENDKLVETAQVSIHPLPFTKWAIGYFPKGGIPSREMLEKLVDLGKLYKCIFIKLEPNVTTYNPQLITYNPQLIYSSHPLFTKYTFQLDLTPSEEQFLKNMHPKTRYNIKVAQKHGVIISEDNSDKAFNKYLELLMETTKRQKFYAHNKKYHELMWESFKIQNSKFKIQNSLTAHLLVAKYRPPNHEKDLTLTTWIVFLFNDVLYYPYGASSDKFRNIMASNLMMWEAIRFGKKHGAKLFDMWGALGPNPDKNGPWYGFHRFKEGYGSRLIEFIGSYDLIINPVAYNLYNLVHKLREFFLRIHVTMF